jgi:4-amino-4-deoxy-L-arabinose transferase-like glycosyltransferase
MLLSSVIAVADARIAPLAEAMIARWAALAERVKPLVLIVLAWAVLVLPLVFLRGYNSDEGLAVSLARTALDEGRWLEPHVFNIRWVERPALLSWLIAAISLPFGSVTQVTARLPVALFVLGGAVLVYVAARDIASRGAALLGAAAFLACPLVIGGYVMITADLPLAVVLFAAFLIWWRGTEQGGPSLRRWLVIAGVLALAALLKGPQPLGFFFIGVGTFCLLTRTFRQLPGLILAGVLCAVPVGLWYLSVFARGDEAEWARFMRLSPGVGAPLPGPPVAFLRTIVAMLPAVLLAVLFLVTDRFRGTLPRVPHRLVTALACYAFACSIPVLFWPGGAAPRYFFPAVPPLAVLAALAFDACRTARPRALGAGLAVVLGLLVYAVGYSVLAAPVLSREFRSTAQDGQRVAEATGRGATPIYRVDFAALNVMPYVPGRIVTITAAEIATVPRGAFLVVPSERASQLLSATPAIFAEVFRFGRFGEWRLLRRD